MDANGRKVSLENIANVVSSMGPNTISRENVARKLVISANVADRDLRGVVNDIQKKSIVKSSYRKDITLNMADNLKVSRLLHASSLLPPYFLYWSSSCSYSRNSKYDPVTGNSTESATGPDRRRFQHLFHIGYIKYTGNHRLYLLFGIATRNGMLLIDKYNSLRASGMSVNDSILYGSLDRLNRF